MANWILFYLTAVGLKCIVNCDTISEIIAQRSELTVLYRVMNGIDFFDKDLNEEGTYTVFAPIDSAFDKIPHLDRQRYTAISKSSNAKIELNDIMKYHTATRQDSNGRFLAYRDDELGSNVAMSALVATKRLFFNTIDGKYYVNGAMLQEGKTNLIADNGIIHMIDTFMYELPDVNAALTYISDNGADDEYGVRFSMFQEFLTDYAELSNLGQESAVNALSQGFQPITVFVPSDEAMNKLNRLRLNQARNNNALLKQIVDSHVIRGVAYHGNMLIAKANAGETVPAVSEEDIVPKFFSNHLEVSNLCAKGRVIHANITVYNGVVHIIDGLLGYVYNDILSELNEDNQIE